MFLIYQTGVLADIFSLKISFENIIDNSFLFQPSSMAFLWILIFSSDWLMNYWGTKLYYGQVKKFCIFEHGYSVKQITEDELGYPGRLFLRYLSELFFTTVAIWLLLYVCKLYSSWQFYEFFCGFFILSEACVHFRHIRNVTLFSLIKPEVGFYGSIAVPRWMSLRIAFIEFGTFGLGYLIVFFFEPQSYFVLGGVFAALLALLYNFSLSEKLKRLFLSQNPEIKNLKQAISTPKAK
jgi:hypothetical protein